MFFSLLILPTLSPPSSLASDDFATYQEKVKDISSLFTPVPIQKAPTPNFTSEGLTCFSCLSSEGVHTLVVSNHATTFPLDPIPFSLLQNISHDILPFPPFLPINFLFNPHFRPYSGPFQESYSNAIPKETRSSLS